MMPHEKHEGLVGRLVDHRIGRRRDIRLRNLSPATRDGREKVVFVRLRGRASFIVLTCGVRLTVSLGFVERREERGERRRKKRGEASLYVPKIMFRKR